LAHFDAPPATAPSAGPAAPDSRSARPSESIDASSKSHAGSDTPADSSVKATDPPQPNERTVLDDRAIRRALMRIAHEIVESTDQPERLYLVAIPNGGVPLGRILTENLESLTGLCPPLGILDTTLYRDDLSIRGSRPQLRTTEMPSSVDDRVVVIVEDVVSTGRTIRAGMDALMDFGRPSHVRVVALVDRGHRELPIKIDFVGKNIPTQPNEKVIFRADEPDREAVTDGSNVGTLQLIVRGGGDS
jgi:pyrimidine operon attenuation protein/uracil phosphoribosyltransferase